MEVKCTGIIVIGTSSFVLYTEVPLFCESFIRNSTVLGLLFLPHLPVLIVVHVLTKSVVYVTKKKYTLIMMQFYKTEHRIYRSMHLKRSQMIIM